MAEVLAFTGSTTIPETPESALEKAKGWGLAEVIIIGSTEAGAFVFGGSHSDIPKNLLLVEIARKRLVEASDAS